MNNLIFNILIILYFLIALGHGREVTIAVVKDGPSSEEALIGKIETELARLTKGDPEIKFKSGPEFNAEWDASKMPAIIQNALKDRQVDLILGLGALVTQAASRPDILLSKPFVSTFVERADVAGITYEDDQTLKDNFNMMVVPQRTERDIRAFHHLKSFDELFIAYNAKEEALMGDPRVLLKKYEDTLGVSIKLMAVSDDISTSLSVLDAGAQAILLTRLSHLTKSQRKQLIKGINLRKIPSFSLLGYGDVELGVLAAISPDITDQVVRRVALNLHRLIRGENTDNLPISLSVDSRLLINAQTASQIGYIPNAEIRVLANIINEEALKVDMPILDLRQTFKMAEEGNVRLSISEIDVETSLQNQRIARSDLLPQINADGTYFSMKPRSETFEEFLPDAMLTTGVSISQMIYDDRIVSNLRSSSRIYDASQFQRESARLDALTQSGEGYLSLVLAYLFTRIEAENMRLTEDNLELARLRVDVGYSGRDEVYRWQAELAQNQSSFIISQTVVEDRQINLAQILGVDQSSRWRPNEINVNENEFYFLDGRLDKIYDNSVDWDKFRGLMVTFAISNSPELKTKDKSIEAQEIQVGQRSRRWFLPNFSFNFRYNYDLYRTPEAADADNDSYRMDVIASYPIFNGLERLYEVQKQKSVLSTFEQERQLIQDLVEKRTRTSLRKIESSFPAIKLQNSASRNAQLNLDIVQDKYAQGVVRVTDLLDAQNQYLTSSLNAAAAQYAFLIDLIYFQRAISWFEEEKTEEEKEAFLERVNEVVSGE